VQGVMWKAVHLFLKQGQPGHYQVQVLQQQPVTCMGKLGHTCDGFVELLRQQVARCQISSSSGHLINTQLFTTPGTIRCSRNFKALCCFSYPGTLPGGLLQRHLHC
jgi:hypothetical protein